MNNVKAPTSRSYQELLIASLRNAEEAAGYIEVTLTEASDEPKLDLLQKSKAPHPNPPLIKGREQDYSYFPP